MKQESHDILIEAAKAAPALTMSAITLNHLVAIATILFIVLQAAYLVRKWMREETEWGRKLKRWSMNRVSTQPGDLE